MTRKHYIEFAQAMRATCPVVLIQPERWEQWRRDVNIVADVLSENSGRDVNGNRRFDRERFILACCGGRADLGEAVA